MSLVAGASSLGRSGPWVWQTRWGHHSFHRNRYKILAGKPPSLPPAKTKRYEVPSIAQIDFLPILHSDACSKEVCNHGLSQKITLQDGQRLEIAIMNKVEEPKWQRPEDVRELVWRRMAYQTALASIRALFRRELELSKGRLGIDEDIRLCEEDDQSDFQRRLEVCL